MEWGGRQARPPFTPMIFRKTVRTDPERVFVVVRANADLTIDATCTWETVTGRADGSSVAATAAGLLYAFVGIADTAISSANFGLVQVYGSRFTSRVFQTDTSQAAGLALTPVAAQAYLQSVATTTTSSANVTQQPIFACLLESVASSASSVTISARVFIRAM